MMHARLMSAAFSFLYRNERTATRKELICESATDALSVSSIGTNELQRLLLRLRMLLLVGFQFPLSERTNCNFWHELLKNSNLKSFSFLYRNERTATVHFASSDARRASFSFLYRNERTATRKRVNSAPKPCYTFSFLYRNERTATM